MIGVGAIVHPTVNIGQGCTIGPYSIVGYSPDDRAGISPVISSELAAEVRVECFCVIELGVSIGCGATVDHYVRVGANTTVGAETYLLYGTRVHRNVRIGSRCRISGNCPDGTIIGDGVTHFGRIHHRYSNPAGSWEGTDEPAPKIGSDTVIGAGAILIGEIEIGENCFIAAGEVVRCDVPPRSMYYGGVIIPGDKWTGRLAQAFFSQGA